MKQGFTTVELIVTLFVAAMFVASGYQLYSITNTRSSEARMMSEASNVAYEVLRREGSYIATSSACTSSMTSGVSRSISRSVPTLTNPSIVLYRCVPVAGSPLLRVAVRIQYGASDARREMFHATYISR